MIKYLLVGGKLISSLAVWFGAYMRHYRVLAVVVVLTGFLLGAFVGSVFKSPSTQTTKPRVTISLQHAERQKLTHQLRWLAPQSGVVDQLDYSLEDSSAGAVFSD